MIQPIRVVPMLVLAIALGSCQNHPEKSPSDDRQSERTPTDGAAARTNRTKLIIKNNPLWVEIASTPEARSRGLMFRQELAEDEGVLFVFEYPAHHSFWMSHTSIPLDIAFIDERGFIIDIVQAAPLDDQTTYQSAKPALYAIEANRGWFAKHEIRVGDQVQLDNVEANR